MKIRKPGLNEDTQRTDTNNNTTSNGWPFDSNESKQRVERFFESNEMKFRSIINEHRKYQSNQRKRSPCNHMCCLTNPRMCKINQSHSFDGSVTRANSALSTYGYQVGETKGTSSGRTLPTPKHPQRRISHHGFLLAAAGNTGDLGTNNTNIPFVRSKSIIQDSSGVIYNHPTTDVASKPAVIKLNVSGAPPLVRSHSHVSTSSKMLPQYPNTAGNSFDLGYNAANFPLLRSNSYANDSHKAPPSQANVEIQHHPSYSHVSEANTRPTSFSNASDYSTNKPDSVLWYKNVQENSYNKRTMGPNISKPPEIKIHKPDSDPDSSPEISKKKTASWIQDNSTNQTIIRVVNGKPQTKVQQIVNMFSENKKSVNSTNRPKANEIIGNTLKGFATKLKSNGTGNEPVNVLNHIKTGPITTKAPEKVSEEFRANPLPGRPPEKVIPNKLVDSPLVNFSVLRSQGNSSDHETSNNSISTNAQRTVPNEAPANKVLNKEDLQTKAPVNNDCNKSSDNTKASNGPMFNNAFGIWALERRIEADLNEQQARKQLQRTSSLDQNNLLMPKRGILKNTIKGSSSFSDNKSFFIEQGSTVEGSSFENEQDDDMSVQSMENVRSISVVPDDASTQPPEHREAISERRDLTITNNLNRSKSTASRNSLKRPPLVRQNFVADEDDDENHQPYDFSVTSTNIPQFVATDSEEGKEGGDEEEVTLRESVVTFNDIVGYKTLSSEDVEEDVLVTEDERGNPRKGSNSVNESYKDGAPGIGEDAEQRLKSFEIENNKNKEFKKVYT